MSQLTLGSLFAGIGGFELAATWAGIKPVWSNEIDKFACQVLRKNFTHEIIEKDIREIGAKNLGPVDIISGGFPCQPFSQAGKRKGTEDDRYLWPETLRIINEIRPTWFIGENVAGLLSMAQPIWDSWVESKTNISKGQEDVVIQRAEWYVLNRIIQDIEEIKYQVQTFIIPATSVGTCHKRDRIWIIAYSSSSRLQMRPQQPSDKIKLHEQRTFDAFGRYLPTEWINGFTSGGNIRRGDGVSNRVDRIKGLGNAIVPQVAYEIFKAVISVNEHPVVNNS